MEFDKSKVYTAVNAEELQVGSKVYLADTIEILQKLVVNKAEPTILKNVYDGCRMQRFGNDIDDYILAYLISPPKEPQYKPFPDTATALKIISAHGGWVKDKDGVLNIITGISKGDGVVLEISAYWEASEDALENFVFADDGSPVGVKVDDGTDDA